MEQKRGEGTQRFSLRGKAGSRSGYLRKAGGLEPPYELCKSTTAVSKVNVRYLVFKTQNNLLYLSINDT